jgi:hypothetical protein
MRLLACLDFGVEEVNVRRILIATISVAALSVFFALPAGAGTAGAGFVTVDPASGAPGDPITVAGSCFGLEGFPFEIHFVQGSLDEVLGTGMSGPGGAFSINATVPAGAQPGPAEIRAECIVDSTGPLTTGFTVTAPPAPLPEALAPTAAEPVTAAPVFTG